MAKKKVVKVEKEEKKADEDSKALSYAIIILSVLCVLGCFYLLAYKLTGTDEKVKQAHEKNETEEQNDSDNEHRERTATSIMLGSTFNRDEEEYLVMFYDGEDEDISSDVDAKIENYLHDDENLPVYKVDMSSKFNSSHKTDGKSNKNASSSSDLKINGTTLIKINNGKITKYIEGEDEIDEFFD